MTRTMPTADEGEASRDGRDSRGGARMGTSELYPGVGCCSVSQGVSRLGYARAGMKRRHVVAETDGTLIAPDQRYQLFFQLTRMTRDKGALAKNDRLDALAMAVAYWSKALAVETEKVVQRKRDEMMQAELERYMQHAIGYKPKGRLYAPTMHAR